MFKDVCKLAIKVEKYCQGKRLFGSSYTKPTTLPKPFVPSRLEVTPKESESKDKGKPFVKEFPKQLDGKRCFKCYGYGHFQANCPNRRVLDLKEIKEIDHFALELAEKEKGEEEGETVLTSHVGEMLVLQRILHAKESVKEES